MAGSEGADRPDARIRRAPGEEFVGLCRSHQEVPCHCRPFPAACDGDAQAHGETQPGHARTWPLRPLEQHVNAIFSARRRDQPAARHFRSHPDHRSSPTGGRQELDISISSELELIELVDLEALIGVDKKLILNKLSRAEIAEDIVAFRKTKVLTYVEEKGITYFSRRNSRGAGDLKSLDDPEVRRPANPVRSCECFRHL